MPMIDITAPSGTFPASHEAALLERATAALLKWERATEIPIVVANTGAYLHSLPPVHVAAGGKQALSVRVDVLTPPASLTQEQRQGMTADLTAIVRELAVEGVRDRVWVLFRETVDGGWGLLGRALTNADIQAAVRKSV